MYVINSLFGTDPYEFIMFVVGCYVGGTPEKVVAPVVGPGDNCGGPPVHHQITVTTTTEAKSIARRSSFRRPSIKWGLDPKHIFLFCAFL